MRTTDDEMDREENIYNILKCANKNIYNLIIFYTPDSPLMLNILMEFFAKEFLQHSHNETF